MELILPFIATISVLGFPVFFIFLDYHKKGNIHKAILYIVSFFGLLVIFKFILLPIFSIYIALVIPFLLIIYLFISKR